MARFKLNGRELFLRREGKMRSVNIAKLLIASIILFALFQVYKFVKVRIASIDLPKGKIVFSSDIDGDSEIYTMNINGTGLKQLTYNSATKISIATDDEASLSRDGKRIAFRSSRNEKQNYRILTNSKGRPIGEQFSGGSADIYIMDSNGKNQQPLTFNTLSSYPFFSTDGGKIVFRTLLENKETLMKLINSDGSSEKVLNSSKGQVEFSPDGKRIFNNFGHNIGVTDIDGNNRIELTHFLSSGLEFPVEIKFDISPDGKKIAIITIETRKLSRPDNLDDFYDTFNFYIMNIDGSALEKLYTIDGSALDDLYIYNKQRKWEGFAIENERLADGTIRKKIRRANDLTGGRGTLWRCKFSPDGQYLIFQATFGYKEGIYSLNLKSKKAIDLTNEKEKWNEFLNFVFTPDGEKIVFVAGIMPRVYYSKSKLAVIFRIAKGYFYYFLLRKNPFPIPQYICIMDIDGSNCKRIVRLPNSSKVGRDFIHWENQ